MPLCEECRFFRPVNGTGFCKARSPEETHPSGVPSAKWPKVDKTIEACGEFKVIQ